MSDEKSKSDLSYLGMLGVAPRIPTLLDEYSVENRVYKHQKISIDGYTFTNCAFINCELHTSKGSFHFVDCHFGLSTVYFSGNALSVVRLSALLLGTWEQLAESLRPQIEPDGGVTIK